jgi:hypothetical protein
MRKYYGKFTFKAYEGDDPDYGDDPDKGDVTEKVDVGRPLVGLLGRNKKKIYMSDQETHKGPPYINFFRSYNIQTTSSCRKCIE